jgi:hypothetical protein
MYQDEHVKRNGHISELMPHYTVDILSGSTRPELTLLSGTPFLSSHFPISCFSVLKSETLLTTLL